MTNIVSFQNVSKTFHSGERVTKALNNMTFDVNSGDFVVLLGASGSGKSTLIRTLCGLEAIDKTDGEIRYHHQNIQRNGQVSHAIRRLRAGMGVIFQQFNLVPQLNVIDNVLIGLVSQKNNWSLLFNRFSHEEKALALDCLERVGLADFAYQRASTLSGGQQQRVAIARALIKNCDLLLADEPVASLDPESSRKVMDTLQELGQKFNLTLIVSLHQVDIALRYGKRVIALKNGQCIYDGKTENLTQEGINGIYLKDMIAPCKSSLPSEIPQFISHPHIFTENAREY